MNTLSFFFGVASLQQYASAETVIEEIEEETTNAGSTAESTAQKKKPKRKSNLTKEQIEAKRRAKKA
jgi:hypothetical protein